MFSRFLFVAFAAFLSSSEVGAQTATNVAVLRGLAPLTVLNRSYAGNAALASNFTVTGGIQTGSIRQTILLPFADQQQLALRDAFITSGNLAQLSDGLGTALGSAYLARAHYADREHFTSISPAVAGLIAYTNATTRDDSNSAKFFFANGTTDGWQQIRNSPIFWPAPSVERSSRPSSPCATKIVRWISSRTR